MQIGGKLLVIDAAAAIDRLLEHLQRGVGEGRNIEAELIDTTAVDVCRRNRHDRTDQIGAVPKQDIGVIDIEDFCVDTGIGGWTALSCRTRVESDVRAGRLVR